MGLTVRKQAPAARLPEFGYRYGVMKVIRAALVLSVCFSALAALAAEPLKVLVLDLRSEGEKDTTTRVIRDAVVVELGRDERLEVLSSEDLRRMVTVQSEREVLGCSAESCLAELGAAMGARYIVHGSVGDLGGTTVVNLNLFDTELNKAVARENAEVTNKAALLPAIRAVVERIRARIRPPGGAAPAQPAAPPLGTFTSKPPTEADHTTTTGGPPPALPWLAIGGGTALGIGLLGTAIAGTGALLQTSIASDSRPPAISGHSPEERLEAQATGRTLLLLTGVSAAIAAAGGAVLALGASE